MNTPPTVPVKDHDTDVLDEVLSQVSAEAREGFVRAVRGAAQPQPDLDPTLWGPGPEPEEVREAALNSLRRQYEARRMVLRSSVSRSQAASLLDTTDQTVSLRLDSGDLLGLKQGREWRLPTWQLSPDAERGYLPGLARLHGVFPGGVVSLSLWATTPHVDLDGVTPATALAADKVDKVLHLAHISTAAAW